MFLLTKYRRVELIDFNRSKFGLFTLVGAVAFVGFRIVEASCYVQTTRPCPAPSSTDCSTVQCVAPGAVWECPSDTKVYESAADASVPDLTGGDEGSEGFNETTTVCNTFRPCGSDPCVRDPRNNRRYCPGPVGNPEDATPEDGHTTDDKTCPPPA